MQGRPPAAALWLYIAEPDYLLLYISDWPWISPSPGTFGRWRYFPILCHEVLEFLPQVLGLSVTSCSGLDAGTSMSPPLLIWYIISYFFTWLSPLARLGFVTYLVTCPSSLELCSRVLGFSSLIIPFLFSSKLLFTLDRSFCLSEKRVLSLFVGSPTL